jgi:peroxiredoxin
MPAKQRRADKHRPGKQSPASSSNATVRTIAPRAPGAPANGQANGNAARPVGALSAAVGLTGAARRSPLPPRAARTRAATSRVPLFAAIATVLIVAAISVVAFLLHGSSTSGTSVGALTNANDLNPGPTLLAVGTQAPNFDLATSSGQHYQLSSFKGHPVVLEFFAIWCPHCQNEAPTMVKLNSTFKGQGVQVLSILANPYGKNYDLSGGKDLSLATTTDLSWFEQTFHINFPTLIDPTFATVNQYNANSYPTIYVVDGSGKIAYAGSGEVAYQDLANAITAAMKTTTP